MAKKNKKRDDYPVPGKAYDIYNDGKISPSRLARAKIICVVPRADLARKYFNMWKKAVKRELDESNDPSCYQFWNWNCTTFAFAYIEGRAETRRDPLLFAERDGGGWYAVNWNYMLDISGKYRRKNIKLWKECAAENGKKMKYDSKTGTYSYFDI